MSLEEAHSEFRKWFGDEYDLDALDAVLATAAAERLTGDPLWLLLVSGSGSAKTETAQSLWGAGALVTSTITSEGALLSGTPVRERTKQATGGLLRRIGPSGVVVIKDVTSILSMDRNTRAGVLAALREVHDGRWERNIGTNGGVTLLWEGRIAIVGAVTTAWDRAHDVVAAMGDRFVVLRMDSNAGRQSAGYRAIANTGREIEMRAELADVVGRVVRQVVPRKHDQPVTADELERILAAADLVTIVRTAVDYDYRGDVIDAHAPEMPTRFAKQLSQVIRGAVAVGLTRPEALRLAIRCARDSMPPLRLAILEDVAAHPHTRTQDVRFRLDRPRNTVDRQLQALHMLGALGCDEVELGQGQGQRSVWHYTVAEHINPGAVRVPDLLPPLNGRTEKRERVAVTHKSGTTGMLAV
jgi:hypothetical protein